MPASTIRGPEASDQPANRDPRAASEPTAPSRNPGDEAPAGTPGTGENVCRRCGGSGRLDNRECPDCGGTGRVIEGIGGA
jgi:hypothetical protein